MKRFLLILALFFFTGFSLLAQDEEADQRMGKLQEKMQLYIQKRLNMSQSESQRFSPIFLRYISELRRTHRENNLDRPMLQLKVAELRVRYRDEFRKVIDEQRANRVFQHQKEFENKIIQEIKERKMQNRQGPRNRIRAI
ncbi:MAG: hypothetical protein WBC06_16975 [Chitinophagaceae bacterium]